jgi:ClpP class serine protease
MKKRSRLIAELTENCWAVHPEHYVFLLDFLTGNVLPDKALAEEMREKAREVQAENSNIIGDTGIAYIPLMGMIYPRATMMTEFSGGVTLTELTKQFTAARDDDSVKGIIFDVDGPGGAATGVNEFSNMLYNSRGSKPIYAYVGGTAASATYWITSAVDKVFADATARVGSVGTVVGVPKKGTDTSYVEITNSLSPYKRPNVEDEEHYKNIVKYLDDMTDVFYDSLARNFQLDKNHVIKNFGEGGMKVGNVALQSKMVHEIGSFSGTVESMLEVITDPGYQVAASGSSLFFDMGGRVDSFSVSGVNAKMSEVKGGIMDIKELREKHPNLVSEIEEAASATASKKSEEKLNSVLDLVQSKDIEIAKLASENENLKKANVELEKANLQGKTEVAKSEAKAIFAEKMGNSTIPEPFHKKINKQISFSSFLKEDGTLDKEKYSEAVDNEVADWEATLSSSSKEILGVVTRDPEGEAENKGEDKELDETAARLIGYAK